MASRIFVLSCAAAVLCGILLCPLHCRAEETVTVPLPAPTPPLVTTPLPVNPSAPAPVATVEVAVDPIVRPMSRGGNLGEYSLSFSDEFSGDKLNAKVWDCRTDSRYWSTQKADNVVVADGYLHLKLKKEKAGRLDYSGAGIICKRSFRYGYYEASIKLPPGKGWHTSFCLNQYKSEPTGARQEINVLEDDSISLKEYMVNIQIKKPRPRSFGPKHVGAPNMSADFHVYGCEFTPEKARFFLDGELVSTMDASEFVHDDMSVWISCFGAPLSRTLHIDDTQLPSEVTVDWVRVYEKHK